MGINLDAIISGANSVDDLVSALSAESKQNALASTQIAQIAEAAKGTYNPGAMIKATIKQNSAPSQASAPASSEQSQANPEEALYQRYVADYASKGKSPLSIEDFTKVLDEHKQKVSGKEKK